MEYKLNKGEEEAVDVTNFTSGTLDRYFSSLELTGQVLWDTTKKLLVLVFIEEMMSNPFIIYYTTNEDDIARQNALNCLYGTSCIIKYPKCEGNTPMFVFNTNDILRITEDDIIRSTENNQQRYRE